MASTAKLIDDWTSAGLPRDQATRMALALDEHLDSKVVDKATLETEMAKPRAELAALETRLTIRVVGLVVVQLGLFWAISRLFP